MKTRIDHEPAFLLSSTAWRESSLKIDIFSQNYGRMSLIARSARRRQSDLRGVLVPFVPLSLSWYGSNELLTLHKAEWIGGWRQPMGKNLLSAMYVNELEAARDFFVKYLGGKSNDVYHNRKTDFRSYFITFDDGARLEVMTKPGMTDPEKHLNRTGYIHVAVSVGSKEKVDSLTAELKDAGYEVVSGPRTTGV